MLVPRLNLSPLSSPLVGLGSSGKGGKAEVVTLKQARDRADEVREILGRNGDPFKEASFRISTREKETFGSAADKFIGAMKPSWRNAKYADQWEMTLGDAYCSKIKNLPVRAIGTEHVLQVLTPIWHTKAETASRLRGRIEKVLDLRQREGVAYRRECSRLARSSQHDASPSQEAPARPPHSYPIRAGSRIHGRLARCGYLRSSRFRVPDIERLSIGEVIGAKWDEIDFARKIWTIPKERMKGGREHRVPLSDQAFGIIQRLHNYRINDFIFPGQKKDRPSRIWR